MTDKQPLDEWVEVTDGTTLPGDRFAYVPNPETGVGKITSHKRRAGGVAQTPPEPNLDKTGVKTVVLRAMSDEDLLTRYSSLQRWFGDDFCVELPEEKDHEEAEVYRDEILRRMKGAK